MVTLLVMKNKHSKISKTSWQWTRNYLMVLFVCVFAYYLFVCLLIICFIGVCLYAWCFVVLLSYANCWRKKMYHQQINKRMLWPYYFHPKQKFNTVFINDLFLLYAILAHMKKVYCSNRILQFFLRIS